MSKSMSDELTGDEGTLPMHGNGAHKNGAPANGDAGESATLRGLRENAKVAMDALRDAGRGASAAVSDLGGGAYQAGARTGAQIARQVEAQPMTSVVIAASLGLVAGILLARR
jgi:ElaB/YqjD/DUF883 family membrane-anchored ribosome-binding protein